MYILATSSNWFSKLVRQFFFLLDSIIYGAISKIYDLLITIARTSPLSQADILDMADRIYKLLAIFMVFKVTFSLIMYVVNPDDFSDKNKGVSKLGMNIVVSLSMLILTPYIFSYAYQLQTYILEDNSLATLIFGTSTKKEFFNTAGDDMAYMAMSPFFVPDDSFHELNACSNLTIEEGTGNDKRIVFNPECSGLNNDSDLTAKGGEYETTTSLLKFTKDNNQFTVDNLRVYVKGVNSKNVGLTFRQELATATDPETKEFIMDYSFIFSSVVGVIIVLLLVTYCMDIALRSIKLAFLQLIAPIPIISYVDPKSGKDGLFKKWYQMCFKTYLSLFIRLIALYFAVYIISRVSEMHLVDVIDGSFQTNAFVAIFIIIGALMFAKQLPKILEGLGVKLDGGGFTLNPLKKMEKEALGGKQIRNLTRGAAIGGLAGAAAFGTNLATTGSRFKNAKGFTGKTKAVFSSLGGGASAARRGLMSGIKGEKLGKGFTSSYSGAMKAKHDRVSREQQGIGTFERMGAKINQVTGGMSYTENAKNQVAAVESGKGDVTGFTEALQQKYGDKAYGAEVSEKLRSSKTGYFSKSNKELEVEKKGIDTKKAKIGTLQKGGDTVKDFSTGRNSQIKGYNGDVAAIDATSLEAYKDGVDGKFIANFNETAVKYGRVQAAKKRLDDLKGSENTQEYQKAASELAEAQKEYASDSMHDIYDAIDDKTKPNDVDEIAKARKKVARDKAKSKLDMAVAEDFMESLKARDSAAIGIIESFDDAASVDESIKEVYSKKKSEIFDDSGEIRDTVTPQQMKSFIDIFNGKYSSPLYSAMNTASSELEQSSDEIDLILSARSIQSSEIQNSEEARHRADVENSIGKK